MTPKSQDDERIIQLLITGSGVRVPHNALSNISPQLDELKNN